RPLASGELRITTGIGVAAILVALGCGIAAGLGALPLMLIYVLASLSYSLLLKNFPVVDVIMLAGLSTFRLLAGGLVTGHPVSPSLLAFFGFLFLNIALMMRT